MKISGTSVLHATPDKVWAAITDPAVLAGVIPGCNELNPLGDYRFGLTVTMGVAAIKGSYSGEVSLYDMTEPSQLTMRAQGSGGPGTIDTTVDVKLTDNGDGTTQLDYDATATVGGAAGGVGQRVLSSVAKKTAGKFFSAIDDVLTGKRTVGEPAPAATAATAAPAAGGGAAPSGVAAPQGAAPVGGAPSGRERLVAAASGSDGISPIAYMLVGAAAVAIGVLLGGRIARRH